ncbi:hypothetical protein GW7_17472 [Heterocephalus glaber]|uniref:Uncharacterized protein n=1 Tax=Heterocephalus glaber TaxID=10181 RepID=G5BTX2_HETGA|nr:hypothetical protein GW7_17472 [Heterocephalus glaber]
MTFLVHTASRQAPGFAVATITWILGGTSMDHVWHVDDLSLSYPGTVLAQRRLLVVASILGPLTRAFTVSALRNLHVGTLQKGVTRVPLIFAPGLIVAASGCISVTVLKNRYSTVNIRGICFPPSFPFPFKPNSRESGRAMLMAMPAAFSM